MESQILQLVYCLLVADAQPFLLGPVESGYLHGQQTAPCRVRGGVLALVAYGRKSSHNCFADSQFHPSRLW